MAFRSKLEERVDSLLRHNRVDYKYESEILPYVLECNYYPDFILGDGIYLEVKGYLDQDDRRKMIAVKKAHPEKDIRFVFQNPDNKINPKSRTTYAQWCDKQGFPWCHYQQIPKSWLTSSTIKIECDLS